MNVNWKVRFKNKVWLTSFFAAILTFVYTMLGMFDVYPDITHSEISEIISSILMFLSLMGVIVDPTTAGLNDSIRAMGYEVPYDDELTPTEEHTDKEELDHLFDEAEGLVTVSESMTEEETEVEE